MERLISFKRGLDSLNDEEYNQFLDEFGRKNVNTLLFKAIQDNYFKSDIICDLDESNRIITEIITSRSTNIGADDEKIDIKAVTNTYSLVPVIPHNKIKFTSQIIQIVQIL